jgi:L,D-transpeptidase catalytic domain
MLEPVSRRPRRRWRGRRALWAVCGALLLFAVAFGLVLFARPRVGLTQDSAALARVSVPALDGRIESVVAHDDAGLGIPVVLRRGKVWPRRAIPVGEHLRIELTVRRPGWTSWLLGDTARKTFSLRTPAPGLRSRWLSAPSSGPVAVSFGTPVRRVLIEEGQQSRMLQFSDPRLTVVVGRVVPGLPRAGSVRLTAAPRLWETLPEPVRVSWFPSRQGVQALAEPRLGRQLRPLQPITLTFAQPVQKALGTQTPRITPAIPGHWHELDTHTVSFRPTGLGYPIGAEIGVHLGASLVVDSEKRTASLRTLTWQVPAGSILRLHQLLAWAGYLPVTWHPSADPARTARAQTAAVAAPPPGRFTWRFAHTPPELRALWQPDSWNEVTRGAVMMFEDQHGLDVDGFVGPKVWRALLMDVLAGKRRDGGYSFVYVHRRLPQSLTLWHDGQTILSSPGNTGVPAAPTQLGTFPVFEHIPIGTMSGTNPDGTHYHDPGIRYISYFNHGDAIHAFTRASFGTPQSLGCVELPLDVAARVWPYTPIGTLVTIEN